MYIPLSAICRVVGEVRPDRPGDYERTMLSGAAIGIEVVSRHGAAHNCQSSPLLSLVRRLHFLIPARALFIER